MSDTQDNQLTEDGSGSDLATALARLNKALESLDIAVESSLEANNTSRNSSEEVQRMADDRAKLATELDNCENRAQRLTETNREVSRRLVAAMETVRSVLDQPV